MAYKASCCEAVLSDLLRGADLLRRQPHITLMYKLAEKHGWQPIGGEFCTLLS